VQTDLDLKKEQVIMKIRGILVAMLAEMNPECYRNYVVYEEENKALYVQMLKALWDDSITTIILQEIKE
jgi:hypothetical protein